MPIAPAELLRKATLTTADFGGAGQAPLTIEQVDQFLELAITPQKLLPMARKVTSTATKWQESIIDFTQQILRPGVENQRLNFPDRTTPSTGLTEISTSLFRGEVPISDEVYEDQVARAGFGDVLIRMMAKAVGRDIENIMINSQAIGPNPLLASFDGWLTLAQGPGANIIDATDVGQDYQRIFRSMLSALPYKYKQDVTEMRFLVPVTLVERYRENLADRGTSLGDMMISGTGALVFQGIEIVSVPLVGVDTTVTPNSSYILLTHPMNLIYGVHRDLRFESWRDPREGATSFIVTCRIAAAVSVVAATTIAINVNVEP